MQFPVALQSRNYRIYISGQFLSLIGTFMQQLAMSWMIYKLTNSPMWLGIAGFTAQIPMFIFGLFSGVIVDHVNKHKLLLWTQGLAAVQAITLAVLTLTETVTLTHLIILEFILGTINTFDMTTRQAFVVELVDDRKHLPNVIAINSSVMNLTRLLGPALGGTLIGLIGEGMCFLLNGISYLSVLTALFFVKVKPIVPPPFKIKKIAGELKIGFSTIVKNDHIKSLLFYTAVLSFFGIPFTHFFPALAERTGPNFDANALGWISTCMGLGSLMGALFLATRKGKPTLAKAVGIAGMLFSFCLIALSQAEIFPLVLVAVFTTGSMMLTQLASTNTMIQSTVDDNVRGRVMSFFNIAILGIVPLGSLLMGRLAESFGIGTALLISGSFCLINAYFFMKKVNYINQIIDSKT